MRIIGATWIACSVVAMGMAWAEAKAEPSIAVRGEGFVGYSNLTIETPIAEEERDTFAGGGAGSAAIGFGPFYLQADVFGEATEYDPPSSDLVGGGGHIGLRDASRGAIGIAGTYNDQELEDTVDVDLWRTGVEGELFYDRVTLAVDLGYSEVSGSGDDEGSMYIDAGVSFYPTDRIRLHVMGGGYGVEESDVLGLVGADVELLALDVLSIFTRWEAGIFDDLVEIQQHSLTFGARIYWGAEQPSLVAYDRNHLKNACMGIQLTFGRFC